MMSWLNRFNVKWREWWTTNHSESDYACRQSSWPSPWLNNHGWCSLRYQILLAHSHYTVLYRMEKFACSHDVAWNDVGRLAHQHEKMWEGWYISLRRCGKVGTSAGEDLGRLAHQREMWEGWYISGRRCGKIGISLNGGSWWCGNAGTHQRFSSVKFSCSEPL